MRYDITADYATVDKYRLFVIELIMGNILLKTCHVNEDS